jgi:hypothetical protein
MMFAVQLTFTEQVVILAKQVIARTIAIISAPLSQSKMVWILGPMIAAMLLMSLYFGRYKAEELGWNTAFGNSLVLIFASVDLLRFLFNKGTLFSFDLQNALVFAIVLQGILLTFLNFFHLMPKSIAFGISSGMTINIVVMFVIILIYSNLPLDYITAIACSLLAIAFILAIKIIQAIQPTVIEDEE